MLAFFMTPLGRKIGLSILLVATMAYGYRLITNHAYEVGKEAGRRQTWTEQETTQKALWLADQAKITSDKQALDAKDKELTKALSKNVQAHQKLDQDIDRTIATIEQQRRDVEKQVNETNDSDLVPRIRELLSGIRANPHQPFTEPPIT